MQIVRVAYLEVGTTHENKSPVFVRGLSGFSPEDILLPGFVRACPDFT